MEWVRGKCVGKGAFGAVHVAVDRATGRAFAVKSVEAKTVPAAAMACLESEIRILKRLSSPYVVEYLGDDGDAATTRNLHMELVAGGSAAEAAAAGGLGEGGARGVVRGVAEALRYLHDVAGVVHGDVKGRNVLVGCDGGAKLADFGAARLVSDAAVTRGPRGTPAWMAPEVARGGVPTPASDVWSLGCTAVELLTGKRPWSEFGGACGVGELLFLIGFGGKRPELPASCGGVSDSCRDFLDKCLRRDAGERWTCDQLLRHPFLLSAADDGEPSPFPSPRAVLDWPSMSDSDSESDESEEAAGSEYEVMARAKGRLAELASNTSWGREWEAGPTWEEEEEADSWAPLASPETAANAPVPSNSSAVADGGRDGGVLAVAAAAGAGVRDCFDGQYGHYKCGFALGELGWPPLAVASVLLVSCTVLSLIQSYFGLNQAAVFSAKFWSNFSVAFDFWILRAAAACWSGEPAKEVSWTARRAVVFAAAAAGCHCACPRRNAIASATVQAQLLAWRQGSLMRLPYRRVA